MKPTPLLAEISASDILFPKKVRALLKEVQAYSRLEIQQLMQVSDTIAEATYAMHKKLRIPPPMGEGVPALALYKGHVYQQMAVSSYTKKDWEFAQKHVRIVSGLYGMLRPTDAIMPYRLEMKYRTKEWKDILTAYVREIDEPIVNLASKEYSDAIAFKEVTCPVVTPIFKEKKENGYSIVRVYTKFARGMMADWIITQKIQTCDRLKEFSEGGYRFNNTLSTDTEYVFTRTS